MPLCYYVSMPRPPRKPAPKTARSTLHLDQELWNEARKAAIDEGVPVTRLVERLIREYLERRKRR
jgi:hypothetical protein